MVVRIIIMLKKTNTMTCSCCIKLTITMTTDNNNSSNNNDNNDNNITMADDSSIIIIIPMLKPLNHPSIYPSIHIYPWQMSACISVNTSKISFGWHGLRKKSNQHLMLIYHFFCKEKNKFKYSMRFSKTQ